MSLLLLLAAALVQEEGLEMFAENDGWQIARVGSGCLMTQEFGGDGNTILTVSIDPELSDTPLRILVGNSGWALPEADDAGYSIDFGAAGPAWTDLPAQIFPSENEDGSVDGVISLGFAAERMTPLLEDMAGASEMRLSRRQDSISQFRFNGMERAIRSLGACVGTLP
jgi:hypothetical protein